MLKQGRFKACLGYSEFKVNTIRQLMKLPENGKGCWAWGTYVLVPWHLETRAGLPEV